MRRWCVCAVLGAMALASCSKKSEHLNAVQQEYLRQQADQKSSAQSPALDEKGREDLYVKIPRDQDAQWMRQPYETVEEWVARIREQLELNEDAIELSKRELESLTEEERRLSEKLQGLSRENTSMKAMLQEAPSGPLHDPVEAFTRNKPPPFSIHLVRPGETLYSIALQYYGQSDRITDILLWNQAWVRHPDELVAGVALVLFFDAEADEPLEVAESYLSDLSQAASS